MTLDLETRLRTELREVADSLTVPPAPAWPAGPPADTVRTRRGWLLIAAAVVLVVGLVGLTLRFGLGDDPVRPAPAPPTGPTPSPTAPSTAPTPTPTSISVDAPTVPMVVAGRLFVDGERVEGAWWSVAGQDGGWLGLRRDGRWLWGLGTQPELIEGGGVDAPPVISPNGAYAGQLTRTDGQGGVSGFETAYGGEGLGGLPLDLGSRVDGSFVTIRAVTDDGRVIAQGTKTAVVWSPLQPDATRIDLTKTAPGQVVLGNTAVGLLVTDGPGDLGDGSPYLARLEDDGTLTRLADLPTFDDLSISTGGTWLVHSEWGTARGDALSLPSLLVRRVAGGEEATLRAPDGYGFAVRGQAWEDDDFFVTTLVPDSGESDGEVLARCSPALVRCEVIPTPRG